MSGSVFHIAFIGPGGPEMLLIMLVLLLMFGAKDAPRMFRKLSEIINQIRSTADEFKREVMYSDLNSQTPPADFSDMHEEDDFEDAAFEECEAEEERDYSDETFDRLQQEIDEGSISQNIVEQGTLPDPETPTDGEDDVSKA